MVRALLDAPDLLLLCHPVMGFKPAHRQKVSHLLLTLHGLPYGYTATLLVSSHTAHELQAASYHLPPTTLSFLTVCDSSEGVPSAC